MRLRPRSLYLALAVAAAATACDVGKITGVLQPETGTGDIYRLLTFNSKTIPAEVVQGVEVKSGAMTLSPDSTWIISFVVRQAAGGAETNNLQTTRGTYSVAGTTLNMRFTGDTTIRLSGTYSTTDITLRDVTVVNGDVLVFRK